MKNNQPIPPEHQHIARGSGAAAILMFLQIAAVGYLAFTIGNCLADQGPPLVHRFQDWRAAILYWFPAGFASMTYFPTNSITKITGLTAKFIGMVTTAFFGGLVSSPIHYPAAYSKGIILTGFGAMLVGIGLAWLGRLLFSALTAPTRERWEMEQA